MIRPTSSLPLSAPNSALQATAQSEPRLSAKSLARPERSSRYVQLPKCEGNIEQGGSIMPEVAFRFALSGRRRVPFGDLEGLVPSKSK